MSIFFEGVVHGLGDQSESDVDSFWCSFSDADGKKDLFVGGG
jgi:hypothetical protein